MIVSRAIVFTLATILAISQVSCFIADNLRDDKAKREHAIKDLRFLASKLPPPAGFVQQPAEESLDLHKVFIAFRYKSTDSCESTANHYKRLLEEQGWDVAGVQPRYRVGGRATIDTEFRHGEYVVIVSCESTQNGDALKVQDLYLTWGLL